MADEKDITQFFEKRLVIVKPNQIAMPDSGDYVGIVSALDAESINLNPYFYNGSPHEKLHHEIKGNLLRLIQGKSLINTSTARESYHTSPINIRRNAIANMRVI